MMWVRALLFACVVLPISCSSPCTTAAPAPPAAPCTTVAPAAPCTTVAPPTCTSFTCPAGWVQRPQAYNLQGTLSAELCCLHPTTTPCTTTTHLTCASFTCPAGWVKRPQAYNLQLQGTLSAGQTVCCLTPEVVTPGPPLVAVTTAGPPTC